MGLTIPLQLILAEVAVRPLFQDMEIEHNHCFNLSFMLVYILLGPFDLDDSVNGT